MTEQDLVIMLEKWQEDPKEFLNKSENKNIEQPMLIKYLENINSQYYENIEKQQIINELQSNLDKSIEIINKKKEIYEDKISGNIQKIDNLNSELKKNRGKFKSFFDSLQETNDQEISQKKINFFQNEIEELNNVKKKIGHSQNTFNKLENLDYSQRNKNLIIIKTDILKRLETVKLDNLSRDEISIINKSMNLSDNSISNPNSFHNNILYLSFYIGVVGIFIYFLK